MIGGRVTRFELRLGEQGYPDVLSRTPRPPRRLYGMGDPAALVPALAIIGSRRATPYGLGCADAFGTFAAQNGVIVVSGAAAGCDMTAQLAAIDAAGRSVAVLGCGADVDYPARASALLARLRAGAGAVISEFEWGVPPLRGHFPARNRIIAGLANAVLVVEAALPSGTFSTADHALEAGRDVLAVPGSILFAGSAGCNRLIRQGAAPIGSVEDLADSLVGADLIAPRQAAAAGMGARVLASDQGHDVVARALLADPMSPDAVAVALDMDAADVMRRIGRLEARGVVARYPDGRYGATAAH